MQYKEAALLGMYHGKDRGLWNALKEEQERGAPPGAKAAWEQAQSGMLRPAFVLFPTVSWSFPKEKGTVYVSPLVQTIQQCNRSPLI